MIRRATLSDIDALIQMGAMMHAESPRFRHMTFRPDKLQALAEPLMEHGILLLAEQAGEAVGMAVGFVMENFFTDYRIASDLAIYVVPEHRGGLWFPRLVRAFEARGAELGADEFCIAVATEVQTEITAGLFERLGYHRSSIGMIKNVRPIETRLAHAG